MIRMIQMEVSIPHKFVSRKYQRPFLAALDSGYKKLIIVWHRRSGKEKTCLNAVIRQMVKRVGGYYYMFPELKQGRRILWDGIDKDGMKFLDHFPPELIESKNESEMKVKLVNGSVFQILGADQYDSNVGANPVMMVFSEYSLCDPAAYGFYRPILAENDGIAVFNFTPRGENHAHTLYEMAKDDNAWFTQILTVNDTKAIPEDVLKTEEREIIRLYGNNALYRQEYFCDFTVPIVGAYYSDQMVSAYDEGRINTIPHEPKVPVSTFWDLGINDRNAIWYAQRIGGEIRLIDFNSQSGKSLVDWIKIVKDKPYLYESHYAPHDIRVKEYTSGKSRLEVAREHGINFKIVPKLSVTEGIDAVRNTLPKCWFDKVKCKEGIDALKSYRKIYDETKKTYLDTPYHDWSSNGADAFRYMALSIDHKHITTGHLLSIMKAKRDQGKSWHNGAYVPVKPTMAA